MEKGLTKTDSSAIKGIAILMLIFHHLFFKTNRFENFTIDFSPFSQGFVVNTAMLFKVCVSIFAFITGYGLLKSISNVKINPENTLRWTVKRLLKTLSGFWFIYVLVFIVTMAIDRLPIEKYFTDDKPLNGIIYLITDFLGLAHLFDSPTLSATWWYMSAAVLFIIFIPIIYAVSRKIGYLPAAVAVCALPRLLNVGYPGGANIYTFILSVIFGMIFADYNLFERMSEKTPKNKFVAWILPFVIFGGILAVADLYIPYLYDRTKVWEITYGVVPVVFICFFRYCVIRIPVIKNILDFLGKHSMTIFLTHTFLRYNYFNEFIYSRKHFMLVYLTLLVMSVALAVVIDYIKKLCRYDRLVSKMLKKADTAIAHSFHRGEVQAG